MRPPKPPLHPVAILLAFRNIHLLVSLLFKEVRPIQRITLISISHPLPALPGFLAYPAPPAASSSMSKGFSLYVYVPISLVYSSYRLSSAAFKCNDWAP